MVCRSEGFEFVLMPMKQGGTGHQPNYLNYLYLLHIFNLFEIKGGEDQTA
jgi:hypothetical protein